MKVTAVEKGSPAEKAGIRVGDEILSVNGAPIRDALDFLFASAESHVSMRLVREGVERVVRIRRLNRRSSGSGGQASLGLILPPDPVRRCGNRCVFCFVDQNPPGLRRSLYVKDEDYRLSLLFGNYVTLTNLRAWETERILAQRISPLYVSVHATRPETRRQLLGCRGAGEILPLLRRLISGGIRIHAQIVVVPGMNDGRVLEGTLDDLETLAPGLVSNAIVPVGLTRHRAKLPRLRMVTPAEAGRMIARLEERRARCLAALGTRLHFPADELYLLAGVELPPYASYEGFPQIDNGVGMVREFEHRLKRMCGLFRPLELARGGPGRAAGRRDRAGEIVIATGRRFAPILETLLPAALARGGGAARARLRIVGVRNRLFGARVTAAGLLGGRDICAALRAARAASGRIDLAVVPPEVFNADGLTLDGWSLADMAAAIGAPVQADLGGTSLIARPADARRSAPRPAVGRRTKGRARCVCR